MSRLLNYDSQLLLAGAFVKVRFYIESCWIHCNAKSLTNQWLYGKRSMPANSAGLAKFHIYTYALLNEINNKLPCLFDSYTL